MRKRERIAAVLVVAGGLLIGGLVALFFHASETDAYGNSGMCISAWDRMTGNFAHNQITSSNYSALLSIGTACQHRISGLDLIAAVCLIAAMVVVVAGWFAVRDGSRETSSTHPM